MSPLCSTIAGFTFANRVMADDGGPVFRDFRPAISRLISLLSFQILARCIIMDKLTILRLEKVEKKNQNFDHSSTLKR